MHVLYNFGLQSSSVAMPATIFEEVIKYCEAKTQFRESLPHSHTLLDGTNTSTWHDVGTKANLCVVQPSNVRGLVVRSELA